MVHCARDRTATLATGHKVLTEIQRSQHDYVLSSPFKFAGYVKQSNTKNAQKKADLRICVLIPKVVNHSWLQKRRGM